MFGLTPVHLIIVGVIVLFVVGPGRLPDTGAAVGKAIREFRHAVDGSQAAVTLDAIVASPLAAPSIVQAEVISKTPDATVVAVIPGVQPGESVSVEVAMPN